MKDMVVYSAVTICSKKYVRITVNGNEHQHTHTQPSMCTCLFAHFILHTLHLLYKWLNCVQKNKEKLCW